MTVLLNFIASPGSGKTTTSAELFTKMKHAGLNVELCMEWVKKWAYEEKKINKYDQFYITGKEIHQQSRLFNRVDYIISDSPVYLGAFYNYYYNHNDSLFNSCKEFYRLAEEEGVKVINIFIRRNKPYNPVGRYQTKEESDLISEEILKWMDYHNIKYIPLDCVDRNRISQIEEILVENRCLEYE